MSENVIRQCIKLLESALKSEIKTWVDPDTNLEWEVETSKKKMSQEEGLKYAESLGEGWRLPTIKELISLVDYERSHSSCKTNNLQTSSACYWSSTNYIGDSDNALNMNFKDGSVSYDEKSYSHYVRCVKHDKTPKP